MSSKSTTHNIDDKIWNPRFTQLFLVNALLSFGHFMMSALVPRYAEHLGSPPSTVGIVASAFAITALAVRPVVGPATTSFRKNILFALSGFMMLLSSLCYGLSDGVTGLLIGRLLQGIGMGFLAPVSLAMVSDALPSSKFASGIGIFSLGQALAMAFGPSAGLAVVERFDYRGVFIFGSILVGISVVMALLLKTKEAERTRFHFSMNNFVAKEVAVPAVMMFFLSGAQATIQAFILIYGGLSEVSQIGLFFTTYALCLLVSRPLSGRVADRYGMDKMIIPGMVVYALSFVVISFSHSLPMFLLAGAISAFGYGICQPLVQTLCMKMVTPERRGVASNTNYIGVDIGFFCMPIVAGWIITVAQQLGSDNIRAYSIMFLLMVIPIGIALAIFLARRKKMREFF